MGFTKHSGSTENKVYEKLRKRSYRQTLRHPVRYPFARHEAYVAGLHDAIYEMMRGRRS